MVKREQPSGPGGTVRIEDSNDFRSTIAKGLKSDFAPMLVVIAGPDVGTSMRLERTVTLGRGRGADEVLTDASVSTTHVRIEDRGDAWAVVDLGSTNGTRVDDELVTEALLQHDTKIQIGTTILRFEIRDETDQAYGELVERLISIDDLTGLYQRRFFDRELGGLLATEASDVALLVMDLDGIKRLNDTHGHLFGAHVIGEAGRRIGRILAEVPGAFGARFGGDEYTVAAPRVPRAAALALAERLRAAIADSAYTKDGIELRVGVSIGLAVTPEDGTTAVSLFQRADAAMYRAKAAGKNRVAG
jgi:two-component system, cell cycle response regulator